MSTDKDQPVYTVRTASEILAALRNRSDPPRLPVGLAKDVKRTNDALKVVLMLKAAPGALTAAELAARTGLPFATVLEALSVAQVGGFVARVPDARKGFPSRWRATEFDL